VSDTAYGAMREDSKRRRADNRERSTAELTSRGIAFESKNHGTHLMLKTSIGVVDFWPGTGAWSGRVSRTTGRGLFNLLRHLQKDES